MKTVKIDLPNYLDEIELHIFADEHIGDRLCDLRKLQERIEYVKNTPNAYCIMNGDLLDNATTASVGDTYRQSISPMEQMSIANELFYPIKDKILAMTQGNHEARTYRTEGIDLTELLAQQFGILDRYESEGLVLFIRFGSPKNNHGDEKRKMCYSMYCTHGSGGGKKAGGKINRLMDLAAIIDTDIYLHGHTHLPAVIKENFFRIDNKNSCVSEVTKLFVNNGANLKYGGYGQKASFKPASIATPIIYLSGTKKEIKAKL